jgi:hypothetical protein
LSGILSGSTGSAAVVWVVVVVVELVGATVADGAGFTVEACTSKSELSFLVEGPLGRGGVTAFGRVSASGAFWSSSSGLELGAVEGELVCAFTRERAAKMAAPTQIKVLKRLAINMM